MRLFKSILFISVTCLGLTACTDDAPDAMAVATFSPNETVTGEELFVVCGFCHGTAGQGNVRRDGPALAGLEPRVEEEGRVP